ncbi:MAG: TetR/AcrR family transcriptional regulator [Gammaproteobacteria bacterium]|nr:TetR/AcrR family transcriptional regulator [Gammaproteobacteria bacterium]
MQPEKVIQDDQAVRDRIMSSALARFRHYGYSKTTMSEIAADSGMSTANIYRYFENKQEIASRCVSICIRDRIERVEDASGNEHLRARDKLRVFVQTLLKNCHETYSQDVKIHELVIFISNEHPDIIHNKIARLQGLLERILTHGNSTGEFDVRDIPTTARAIYSAIAVFDVPLFMNFYPLEEFQKRADEVVDLILEGLAAKPSRHTREGNPDE